MERALSSPPLFDEYLKSPSNLLELSAENPESQGGEEHTEWL